MNQTGLEVEPESPASINHNPTVPEIDASLPQYSIPSPPTGIVLDPTPVDLRSVLSKERAISLCKILLKRLVWMFSIVTEEHLVETLIPAAYYPNRMDSLRCSPHDLALLLTALAIGVLVDFDLGLDIEVAQLYIRLAWSTALLPALPTIATVKTLHLMSIYHGMAGDKYDSHRLLISAWQCLHHVGFIFRDFTAIEADIGLVDQITCVAI